ncbi:MAG: amino acid adenylation domain-containing protein [Alphaproteobacteria bacterium]|nr:amino acid adenylation domain-containing protein [Alphaproteobacteria bacterium]
MLVAPASAPLLEAILEPGPGGGSVALQAGDEAVTYAELRRSVADLAEALGRAGVRPGDRVALALPKSIVAAEAILAVLAIGAVYVPLNTRQPTIRLRAILDDLEPALIVTTREIGRALHAQWGPGGGFPVAMFGALGLDIAKAAARPAAAAECEGLATVLYTSGSTGEPKGIMLSHANIASFVDWAAETFAIGPDDRLASNAPFHFDLSVFDLFCGLARHATVHLFDEDAARFPGQVRAWIDAACVTVWYSVPTALARLQQRRALRGAGSLRLVLFAGEVFPVPALRQLMADLPQPEYVNLYGPTETNVCTYYRLPGPPSSDTETLPIGRACEHLSVSLRDPALREVAAGDIGEICIEGSAVMRGYWRRPEMTAASRLPGREKSYRTGDYGWRRGDGEIMFAGRRDDQVKIRGQRIELLALEAVLNAHPEVGEAAALAFPDDTGGRLAAFLVPRRGVLPEAEIRSFVAQRLPACYQPDRFDWVAELPRTATGKCDRAILLSSLGLSPQQADR